MASKAVSSITLHDDPSASAESLGGGTDVLVGIHGTPTVKYKLRGIHVLTLTLATASVWGQAAIAGTHFTKYQTVKLNLVGGGVEVYRVESIDVSYDGGGVTVECWPYWTMLDRRILRIGRGTFVDPTIALVGLSPLEALTQIVTLVTVPHFAVGTVAASLSSATVSLDINTATPLASLWALCSALADVNGGFPAEFVERWSGSTCYIDIVPFVGYSAAEQAASYTPNPNSRYISGPVGSGATKGRIANRMTDAAEDFFNTAVPMATFEGQGPLTIGQATWAIASASFDGTRTTITLEDSPLADPLDLSVYPSLYFGNDDDGFFAWYSTAADNQCVVTGNASALTSGRFAESSGGQELVALRNGDASGNAVNEQAVTFELPPYANLGADNGASADMSEGWGTAPTGMSAIGSASISQYAAATYPEYVRSGKFGAHVAGNSGDGVSIALGTLNPTEDRPWFSVSVDLAVIAGRVRVTVLDSAGTEHPLGINQAESNSKQLRSLQIGGIEPAAGAATLRIVAREASTQFVVDAFTLTNTPSPYPFQARMGPRDLWMLGLKYLREHGGSNPRYKVKAMDPAFLDAGNAAIEIGSHVRLQDGWDGSAYRLDTTGRVFELSIALSTTNAPIIKDLVVGRDRPTIVSSLVSSSTAARIDVSPGTEDAEQLVESYVVDFLDRVAELYGSHAAGSYSWMNFENVQVEIPYGTKLVLQSAGQPAVTFYAVETIPVTADETSVVAYVSTNEPTYTAGYEGDHNYVTNQANVTLSGTYDDEDPIALPSHVMATLIYQNAEAIGLRATIEALEDGYEGSTFTTMNGAYAGTRAYIVVDPTPHRIDDDEKLRIFVYPTFQTITVNGDHAQGSTVISIDLATMDYPDGAKVLYYGPSQAAELKVAGDEILLRAKRNELIDDINTVTQTSVSIDPDKIEIDGTTIFGPGYNSVRAIIQSTAPTTRTDGSALIAGDTWYDDDDGYRPYTWNGSSWLEALTIIDGGHITTGQIESNNWSTSAGSQFDLVTGTFKLGGSSAPKLSWNGSTLAIVGTVDITGDSDLDAVLTLGTGGKVEIGAAGMAFGYDVEGTNDGLWIGTHNYWYTDGSFKVGDADAYLEWDGADLEIKGTVKATGGEISGTLSVLTGGSLDVDSGNVVLDENGLTIAGSVITPTYATDPTVLRIGPLLAHGGAWNISGIRDAAYIGFDESTPSNSVLYISAGTGSGGTLVLRGETIDFDGAVSGLHIGGLEEVYVGISPSGGDLFYYDGSNARFDAASPGSLGLWKNVYSTYSTDSHGSSTSEASIINPASYVGSRSFSANYFQAGSRLQLVAGGEYTDNGYTCTLRLYLNATGSGGTDATDCLKITIPTNGYLQAKWHLDARLVVTGTGGTNNVRVTGRFYLEGSSTWDPATNFNIDATGDLTTTGSSIINLTALHSGNDLYQAITCEYCDVDVAHSA